MELPGIEPDGNSPETGSELRKHNDVRSVDGMRRPAETLEDVDRVHIDLRRPRDALDSLAEFDYDGYGEALRALHDAAYEYATWALWDRLPAGAQGDMSQKARQARRDMAQAAAARWVELYLRVQSMNAQYEAGAK
ncbi:hypothetical protein [Mycobacterium branderi]|uniref:ESX-1 secretion-associated protein n=1 Tax=Mycobacterium branderi TaxID=43348 RepID=A0ABM7KUJ9_9MYCO|nr:hypothetical protein [Mycobacterium branderi]MCV7232740.1 hypothetical protein [Mycobacterium branderi]BBZ09836.1 hypothetical protein MBRA_00310 [Mycobacterium branderi]BBZ14780.1 hypothetical protein MBRA_49750 [Mycobacterium branderi]